MGKLFVFSIEDPQNPEMVFYLTSNNEFIEGPNEFRLDGTNKFFSIKDNCEQEVDINCLIQTENNSEELSTFTQNVFNEKYVFVINEAGDLYKASGNYNNEAIEFTLTKMTQDSTTVSELNNNDESVVNASVDEIPPYTGEAQDEDAEEEQKRLEQKRREEEEQKRREEEEEQKRREEEEEQKRREEETLAKEEEQKRLEQERREEEEQRIAAEAAQQHEDQIDENTKSTIEENLTEEKTESLNISELLGKIKESESYNFFANKENSYQGGGDDESELKNIWSNVTNRFSEFVDTYLSNPLVLKMNSFTPKVDKKDLENMKISWNINEDGTTKVVQSNFYDFFKNVLLFNFLKAPTRELFVKSLTEFLSDRERETNKDTSLSNEVIMENVLAKDKSNLIKMLPEGDKNLSQIEPNNILVLHIEKFSSLLRFKYSSPDYSTEIDDLSLINFLLEQMDNLISVYQKAEIEVNLALLTNNTTFNSQLDNVMKKLSNNKFITFCKTNNFEKNTYNRRFNPMFNEITYTKPDGKTRSKHDTMLLGYRDDNFPYYEKKEKMGLSEFLTGFSKLNNNYDGIYPMENSNYEGVINIEKKQYSFKIDDLKHAINEKFNIYSVTNNRVDDIDSITEYKKNYVFGAFQEIYPHTKSNKEIAENMEDVLMQLESGIPVFMIGYGASGAGKTSSLIYFNQAEDPDYKQGILIHLCNLLAQKGFTKASVSTKEYFESAVNPGDDFEVQGTLGSASVSVMEQFCEIEEKQGETEKMAPLKYYVCRSTPKNEDGMETYIDFEYTNGRFEATNYKPLPFGAIHKYRLNGEEKPEVSEKPDLGELMIHIIDTDRFVKGTTNNPNSSRSHVVVGVTLTHTDGRKASFYVGDFAGVENAFICSSYSTLINFLNVSKPGNPPYYSQQFHGGNKKTKRRKMKKNVTKRKGMKGGDKNKLYDTTFAKTEDMDVALMSQEKLVNLIEPQVNDTIKAIYSDMTTKLMSRLIKNLFVHYGGVTHKIHNELQIEATRKIAFFSPNPNAKDVQEFKNIGEIYSYIETDFANAKKVLNNYNRIKFILEKLATVGDSREDVFRLCVVDVFFDKLNDVIPQTGGQLTPTQQAMKKKTLGNLKEAYRTAHDTREKIDDIHGKGPRMSKGRNPKRKVPDLTRANNKYSTAPTKNSSISDAEISVDTVSGPFLFKSEEIVRNMDNILKGIAKGASSDGTEYNANNYQGAELPGQLPPTPEESYYKKVSISKELTSNRGNYHKANNNNIKTLLHHRYSQSPKTFTQKEIIRLLLFLIVETQEMGTSTICKFHFYNLPGKQNFKVEELFNQEFFEPKWDITEKGEFVDGNRYSTFQVNAMRGLVLYTYLFSEIENTITKLSYARDICQNRLNEGNFINLSLSAVRSTIGDIISVKSEDAIYNSPYFVDKCLSTYCPDKTNCFYSGAFGNTSTIGSTIMKDIFDDIKIRGGKPDNYEIKDFYKEVLVSVFCVLNLSRVANNPPPTPYFDINKFKQIHTYYPNEKIGEKHELLVDIFARLDEFDTNKFQVQALKNSDGKENNNIKKFNTKIQEIRKKIKEYTKRKSELETEIKEVSDSIKQQIKDLVGRKTFENHTKDEYDKNPKLKQRVITKEKNRLQGIQRQYTEAVETCNSKIKILREKITWFEKEEYKADPKNINVKVSIDATLVEDQANKKCLKTLVNDLEGEEAIEDFYQKSDSNEKIEELIKSIDSNNAASAIGTLEFIDMLSKFNFPHTLCYYNPTHDYVEKDIIIDDEYLDDAERYQQEIENMFTKPYNDFLEK